MRPIRPFWLIAADQLIDQLHTHPTGRNAGRTKMRWYLFTVLSTVHFLIVFIGHPVAIEIRYNVLHAVLHDRKPSVRIIVGNQPSGMLILTVPFIIAWYISYSAQ